MRTLTNIQSGKLNEFGNFFQNVDFLNQGAQDIFDLIEKELSDEIEDIEDSEEFWWSEFIDPTDQKHYVIAAEGAATSDGKYVVAEIEYENKNLSDRFYQSIHESILALDSVEDIVNYYGDSNECTIESYYRAQISEGKLYDSCDEMSEDTCLGYIEDYKDEFEEQRKEAFENWLNNLVDDTDEDELIDVSDKVVIAPQTFPVETDDNGGYEDATLYDEVTLNGKESDFQDSETSTQGSSLFEKIFSLMNELPCGQNVRKAAIIAGAKYVFCHSTDDDYTMYFWKETTTEEDVKELDDLVEIVKFDAGGARSYLTVKSLDESADINDALEIANRDYPCSEGEEWDSFNFEFDEQGIIVLHR